MAFAERAHLRSRLTGAFLAGISVLSLSSTSLHAQTNSGNTAQAPGTVDFAVPAGPLENALLQFGRQAGLRIVYPSEIARGKNSRGVNGKHAPQTALAQVLAGSGLNYSFTNRNTVTIVNGGSATGAPIDAAGTTLLDTITVTGGNGASLTDAPYYTDAPTAYISSENIDRFRGSSPADIFRGTAGVMSGEARNGAGSIDVNIRGMQGFGRVATTVDGAENAVTVYQGYQGVSNRTFVDPDFIAGIEIKKGADTASWGNAGSVTMRTLSADDIVKSGNTWGLRVKGGFGTNTSKPETDAISGYQYQSGAGTATPSATGMDRPSFLTPTSGSGSAVAAYKGESIDLLAGYARRKQGNYHAGKHGPSAEPLNIGTTTDVWGLPQQNTMINNGLVNYRGGEEVLNTQLETESWLAKATAHIADDQTLQVGYMGYRSEAGDRLASRLTGITGQAVQQEQTVGTSLDTFTARYNWNPEDNDLLDLKTNLYWSHLELRNPIRGGRGVKPEQIGLPSDFRVGSDTDMWGADISNKSKFSFDQGDLDLTYGLSYRAEDTRGSRHTAELEGWLTPRDGIRHEAAGFVKAAYKPVDWLTLSSGLRYSHFWTKDRFDPYERNQVRDKPLNFRTDDGGFSPSAGVTIEPWEGKQFFVNYSNTLRAPSIIESVSAFNSVVAQEGVKPERSSNWEIGTNLVQDSLLTDSDRGMLKFGYFNWDVKDYLARNVIASPGGGIALNIANIDRARFSGLELSGRYENGGFTADLSANYYLNVEYCRTADTCSSKSLYGDYATNHVQPEYSIDLTLSQKLLEDRLTLGGRVSHIGPRAIGHGDVTAQGASQFIAPVIWEPYTLVDVFAEYKVNENLTAAVRVENLFDQFYVDPLSLVTQPGPGRTFYASLTADLGGEQKLPPLPSFLSPERKARKDGVVDWTGFYAGVHAGGAFGHTWGDTTTLDGTENPAAARESADQSFDSGLFGVQAGYNWQLGNRFVLGVEADWSKTYLHGSQKTLSTDPVLAANGHVDANTSYDIDWTSSVRGRLGYAVSDKLLAYATGGLALARETQWRDQYVSNRADENQPLGDETSVFFVDRASATRAGFTIGGGMEYALNDRWSLKADYTYSYFRKKNFKYKDARAGTGKDYTTTTSKIVGYETIDYSKDPNMSGICEIVPDICVPFESPIYEYEHTDHIGGSSIADGRSASNALGIHTIKLGLNYRF